MNKYKSLTFLEVLITLTILSIVSILVVGLLKPQETFKAARDTKRITSIKQIEKAIELYLTENQSLDLGSSTIIYISLPDNSPTCSAWISQLPPLPSGYEYRCSANPQNIDGTGWIPIDFTKSSITNISSLSIDPINSPPYYFAYVADNNKKSFEITAYLESERNKGENSVSANDYGTNIYLYEGGSDKGLHPSDYETARVGILPSGVLIWFTTSSRGKPYSVATDITGVYIGGYGSTYRGRLEKRNVQTGNLEWFYDYPISTKVYEIYSILIDDSSIYIAAKHSTGTAPGDIEWIIERRNKTNNSLIWSVVSNPTRYADDIPYTMALDNSGIYIGGMQNYGGRWRIEKRTTSTGELIWVNTSTKASFKGVSSMAVDEEGLYIVGDHTSNTIRIEKRDKNTGNLIWFVTSTGYVPSSLAVTNNGVYIAFSENSGDTRWRIEKRNKNSGSLDWYIISDPSPSVDVPYSIVVDDISLFIVGCESTSEGYKWRIEKRDLNDGDLIWHFTSVKGCAYSVAVDSTAIYIVGANDTQWRIEKRVK